MKKYLLGVLLLLIPFFSIDAASLSVSLKCAKTVVKAGDTVSCTVSATTNDLVGIQFSYDLDGVTYSSFTTSYNFDTKNSNSNGVNVGHSQGLPSSLTIGTLKVKVPSSASAGDTFKVTLSDVRGSDSNFNDIKISDVSANLRIASTVNTLSSLSVTGGELSPAFSKSTTSYTMSTDNAKVKITATKTNSYSSFVSGYGPREVELDYGLNTVYVKVKSESGSTRTYTIKITRNDTRDTVNTLSSLGVEGYDITPTFSSTTTMYRVNVPANVTTATLTATKTSSKSSFVSGYGPRTVKLEYGSNTFKITVKAENTVKRSYTIVINREDDRNQINTLDSLSVKGYDLSPKFSSNTTSYTVNIPSDVTKVRISASKTSDTSSFVSGYGPRTEKVNYGSNTFYIKVNSESKSIKTYTIKVVRKDDRSTNNYLKSLELSDGNISFNKNTLNYTFTVKNEVESINIKAVAEDEKAKISGVGTKTLKVGNNAITIKVTAENGKTRNYVINVKRLDKDNVVSNNNKLSSLEVENYQFTFDSENLQYNITIEDETELNISYLTDDPSSSVVVEGNANLKDGSVINIYVTSSDGNVRTYKINISKNQNERIDKPVGNPTGGEGLSKKEIIIISVSFVVLLILSVIIWYVTTINKVKKKAMEWK